jgi:hypothetical protein
MSIAELLEEDATWRAGLGVVRKLRDEHGEHASVEAMTYAKTYEGRRAAMVFDVVASRQRRYMARVVPMVAEFERTPQARSLERLADDGHVAVGGLRDGEAQTMMHVAAGLIRFGADHGIPGDDEIAQGWASAVSDVEYAPELDPYAGSVIGMGPALFSYLRMRSGADAIKPDLRVRRALKSCGFRMPKGTPGLLMLANGVADELEISRLVLDQLLWHLDL